MKAIYFDMDATICSLYDYPNWLELLHAEDTTPYENCTPMYDMEKLNNLLLEFVSLGITIGIISWSAMNGSKDYNKRVRKAKREWCNKHGLNAISEFHVVKYSTPKHQVAKIKDSILIDDDNNNLTTWKNGDTIDAKGNIVPILKQLLRELQNAA